MKIVIKDDDCYYSKERGLFLYGKENATIYDVDSYLEKDQILNKLKEKFKNNDLEAVEVKPKSSFDEILSEREKSVKKNTNEVVNAFTDFRGHKDSILALLADPSLNHDMNALIGSWRRNNEKQQYFNDVFNLDFSDKVIEEAYHDPNVDHISKYQLAYKARCVAMYFAKLADVFLAVEKHNEKILNEPQNEL